MTNREIFEKYLNGVYWKDLPESEQWRETKDGKRVCVYCGLKGHIGVCHYCHEVIHGQGFYSPVLEGTRVYFHNECHYEWTYNMIMKNKKIRKRR